MQKKTNLWAGAAIIVLGLILLYNLWPEPKPWDSDPESRRLEQMMEAIPQQ